MADINWPIPGSTGELYQSPNGDVWEWNGEIWKSIGSQAGVAGTGDSPQLALWGGANSLIGLTALSWINTPGSDISINLNDSNDIGKYASGYINIERESGVPYTRMKGASNTNTESPLLNIYRSKGTLSAQSPLTSGSIIGETKYWGSYNSATGFYNSASIKVEATESWSSTIAGTKLSISTVIAGATTLAERLSVESDGKVRISGIYKLPNVDGATGQVISTDGAGVLSWTTVSTSPTLQNVLTNGNQSVDQNLEISNNTIFRLGTTGSASWEFTKNSGNNRLEVYNTDEGGITQIFDQEYLHSNGLSTGEMRFAQSYNNVENVYIIGPGLANPYITIAGNSTNPFQGLRYAADYSANYNIRSLVDKGYVDAKILSTSVTGTGTADYLTKWNTGGTSIINSQIRDNGTNIGIGIAPFSNYKFRLQSDSNYLYGVYSGISGSTTGYQIAGTFITTSLNSGAGLYASSSGVNAGTNIGVDAVAYNSSANNFGIRSAVWGSLGFGGTNDMGLQINVGSRSSGSGVASYGAYIRNASATGISQKYGLYITTSGSQDSGGAHGIRNIMSSTTPSGTIYGTYQTVNSVSQQVYGTLNTVTGGTGYNIGNHIIVNGNSAYYNYGLNVDVSGSAGTNIGIRVQVSTTGAYMVQLIDGNEADGKVVTSDAFGRATWEYPTLTFQAYGTTGLGIPPGFGSIVGLTGSVDSGSAPFTSFDTKTKVAKPPNVTDGGLSGYNTSTGIWTCPTTGWYTVGYNIVLRHPSDAWPATSAIMAGIHVATTSADNIMQSVGPSNNYGPNVLTTNAERTLRVTSGTQLALNLLLMGTDNYEVEVGDIVNFYVQYLRP